MKYTIAISCLLAVSGAATAFATDGLVYAPRHASADYYAYPSYAFEYAVRDPHTGDNKAQWEKRHGDLVTGAYSLVEPDGSIRVVEYRADDTSGFKAMVKRIGPNLHPVAQPIYKAPIPHLGHPTAPIIVGSVAGHGGLSNAPIYSKPYTSGAYSSASIYKSANPIVVADIAPAPITPEPLPIAKPLPTSIPTPLPLPIPVPSLHPAPYFPQPSIPMSGPLPYDLGGYGPLESHGSLEGYGPLGEHGSLEGYGPLGEHGSLGEYGPLRGHESLGGYNSLSPNYH